MNPNFLKSLTQEVSKLGYCRATNYSAIRVGGLHGPDERYNNGNIVGVKFERNKRTVQARKFDRPAKQV